MRTEFSALLDQLVEKDHQVQLQLHERFNRFPMPSAPCVTNIEEFQELIARFFRQLFCPHLPIGLDWKLQRECLCAQAFSLLQREYGAQAWVRTCDLARSGNEGGLLGVLRTLTGLLQQELYRRRAWALVDPYWRSTPPARIVKDAQDYLKAYGRLLAGEMAEGSGAPLLAEFQKVLLEHPRLIREMRRAVRR